MRETEEEHLVHFVEVPGHAEILIHVYDVLENLDVVDGREAGRVAVEFLEISYSRRRRVSYSRDVVVGREVFDHCSSVNLRIPQVLQQVCLLEYALTFGGFFLFLPEVPSRREHSRGSRQLRYSASWRRAQRGG